jgi:hypothetical protein
MARNRTRADLTHQSGLIGPVQWVQHFE